VESVASGANDVWVVGGVGTLRRWIGPSWTALFRSGSAAAASGSSVEPVQSPQLHRNDRKRPKVPTTSITETKAIRHADPEWLQALGIKLLVDAGEPSSRMSRRSAPSPTNRGGQPPCASLFQAEDQSAVALHPAGMEHLLIGELHEGGDVAQPPHLGMR
jgi:hypothetical protein